MTLFFAMSLAIAAPPATPEALLDRVQKNYTAFADFSAGFRQTLIRASRPGRGRSETGKVYLKRPGMMRWDYAQPEVKNFVIDGERLWFYKPDEAQVTVYDHFREAEISAGLSFLWGGKNLGESFTVSHYTGADPLAAASAPATSQSAIKPQSAIKLVPKKADPNVKELVFYLDDKGYIAEAVVSDHLGNLNVIEFRDIKLNQGLKKEAFLFAPPDGVKVVHADAPK